MDLVTKISSLVACIRDRDDLFAWFINEPNTPRVPSYWKKKGSVVVLKSFGSKGTVIDLKAYTHLLATEQTIHIKGWISTPTAIVLVVDPKDLPTDISNPYIIMSLPGDVMDHELVLHKIKNKEMIPCTHQVKAKIGYRDTNRRMIRYDIPEELE